MKVFFLIDSLKSGGAQRQIAMLANNLYLRKEADVAIIMYTNGNHYKELTEEIGIPIYCFPKKYKFDLKLLWEILGLVYRTKPDVICAFLFTPSFYAILTRILYFGKVKVLVSERTFEGYLDVIARLTRKLYNYADAISTNSVTQYNILVSKYPKFEGKLFCIKNGVDSNVFNFRAHTHNNYKLVSIGRIERLKNPLCLIEAIKILRVKYNIVVKVSWAGAFYKGHEEDVYYANCLKEIKQNQLESQWEWLGVVKDIPGLLAGADLMIHPSHGEGFPNTICEAMSAGTVVAASNVYDHPYIIQHGVNGFLFNQESPESLAEMIALYYSLSEAEQNNIRKNARLTAINEFAFDKVTDQYLEIFKRV